MSARRDFSTITRAGRPSSICAFTSSPTARWFDVRWNGSVDLCRILVGGSLLVPCSLPGPPVVSVFSPLRPGKGGWSLASQRWLEVNDFGRLVNRYGRRQWHPTPVLLPGKSHGPKSLVGCSPWGRSESGTTERLHFHISLSCIGGGHGNPLQCSCLENPRDCGAWWAAVHGVTQTRTRLKRLRSSSSSSSSSSFK